jgi:PAS domain S-box-containing protein
MPERFPLDVNVLYEVLNYLNLGVYITDRERRIMLWNRKAEEITGHKAGDVEKCCCSDDVLKHQDQNGDILCTSELCPLYRSIMTGKESGEPILVYALNADGDRIPVLVSTAPLRDKDGNIIGGIETFQDASMQVRDLELARDVQRHLLPSSMPADKGVRIDVKYYPMEQVGGDFYDILALPGGGHGIFVSDVRGHGVSAALYTMVMKSFVENHRDSAADTAGFMGAVNEDLSRFVIPGGFASAVYLAVDAASGSVTYANAGHPPPLLFRRDSGTVEQLSEAGLLLGLAPDFPYESSSIQLSPGDVLLCYTDGVTEVKDARGEMLDEEGLASFFAEEASREGAGLLDRLYRSVRDYCNEVVLPDDALLLSITRTG